MRSLGIPIDLSDQDHEGEKASDHSPEPVGKEEILSHEDGEDQKHPSEEHDDEEASQNCAEDDRKLGMNVLHPHDRNVPQEKDQEGQDKTGEHQQTDEDAFLRSLSQMFLPNQLRNVEFTDKWLK